MKTVFVVRVSLSAGIRVAETFPTMRDAYRRASLDSRKWHTEIWRQELTDGMVTFGRLVATMLPPDTDK